MHLQPVIEHRRLFGAVGSDVRVWLSLSEASRRMTSFVRDLFPTEGAVARQKDVWLITRLQTLPSYPPATRPFQSIFHPHPRNTNTGCLKSLFPSPIL